MAKMAGDDLRRGRRGLLLALMGTLSLLAIAVVGFLWFNAAAPAASRTVLRPTGTILMAVRDLARLETNELHMEKVIDLTDKQSRFFGLIDTADAILMVTAGDVTIGIDLTKLEDADVSVDRERGTARVVLP